MNEHFQFEGWPRVDSSYAFDDAQENWEFQKKIQSENIPPKFYGSKLQTSIAPSIFALGNVVRLVKNILRQFFRLIFEFSGPFRIYTPQQNAVMVDIKLWPRNWVAVIFADHESGSRALAPDFAGLVSPQNFNFF